VKAPCVAAALTVAACSVPLPEGELGTAAEACALYSIASVHASPGTVHFTGLPWLLNSGEATGPIVLTAHVGTFVLPVMTSTVSGVDPHAVSHAVGYSLSARHDLLAVSSANLAVGESSRLEAYASFDETTWVVSDPSCGSVLGTGASFDPSGVYFQTVSATHVRLPDMGVYELVAACPDPGEAPPDGRGAGAPRSGVPGFIPSDVNPLLVGGRR
jgi:hypothetical protein